MTDTNPVGAGGAGPLPTGDTLVVAASAPPGDAGVSSPAAPLPSGDNLQYTLTVQQAREWILAAHRKVPSERSMQRYAAEGLIAALKINTVVDGKPRTEWLYNEASLQTWLATQPIIETASAPTGDRPDSSGIAAPATPTPPDAATVAPPAALDDLAEPVGERRTLASVLIENSRLVAEVAGKDAIIAELKDEQMFLREEVRDKRTLNEYMKQIASEMLATFKSIAIETGSRGRQERDAAPMDVEIIAPGKGERRV